MSETTAFQLNYMRTSVINFVNYINTGYFSFEERHLISCCIMRPLNKYSHGAGLIELQCISSSHV